MAPPWLVLVTDRIQLGHQCQWNWRLQKFLCYSSSNVYPGLSSNVRTSMKRLEANLTQMLEPEVRSACPIRVEEWNFGKSGHCVSISHDLYDRQPYCRPLLDLSDKGQRYVMYSQHFVLKFWLNRWRTWSKFTLLAAVDSLNIHLYRQEHYKIFLTLYKNLSMRSNSIFIQIEPTSGRS